MFRTHGTTLMTFRLVGLICLLVFLQGCRKPTESARDNRRLMDAILTAVSTKNTKELRLDEQLLESRHEQKELNDDDFMTLKTAISKASSGAWQEAEADLYRLREAKPFPR